MNEAEFHKLAATMLERIEQAIEACGADIDFENAGEILQLEFTNRSKIIINKQAAASQMPRAPKTKTFQGTMPGVARNIPTTAVNTSSATTLGLVSSR